MAQMTARMLLDIRAVHFNTDTLYTHASGKQAPTYIDCRKLISHPRIRSTTMDFLTCKVMRAAGLEAFDNIAGGETAGIPFAALVAERMALPMSYVRKKPKGYGRAAQIEGEMPEGARVLLVEDLTTDGGSKLKFVDAIRSCGGHLRAHGVVFYYGIFPETRSTGWPSTGWRCTGCAPGPMSSPRRAARAISTRRRWPTWSDSSPIPRPGAPRAGSTDAMRTKPRLRVANLTHSCYPNLKMGG
jgi:orotate phosphoribosyltransferase